MDEILPGAWHWTPPNPKIRDTPVCSDWLDEPGLFADPLIPEDAGMLDALQRVLIWRERRC